MNRLRLKAQLLILNLALLAELLAFGIVAFVSTNSVKVGGPRYERIVLDKDLVADILPPPNYIIESYLIALQIAEPEHAAMRAIEEASTALLGELRDVASGLQAQQTGGSMIVQERTAPAPRRW